MTILYVSLFAASFFLVTYFNGYHFLQKSFLQLMSGILALIVSVSTIFVLFKRSNYQLRNLIMVDESEENDPDAEGTVENDEHHAGVQQNQLESDQTLIVSESAQTIRGESEEKEMISELTQQPSEQPETAQKQKTQTEEDPQNTDEQQTQFIDTSLQSVVSEEEKPASSAVSKPAMTVMMEPENDPLTETQISYIKSSVNSYINENGLPQLVMTNDLSKEDIELRKRQYENPEEILTPREPVNYQQDDEIDEDFYIQDERLESHVAILVRVIAILVVILILISGYYVYSRFLG